MNSLTRKFLCLVLIAGIALLPLQIAMAKGPPDKIVITGPGFKGPVEITDPQILNVFSFYQFENLERGIDKPAMELGEGYHITRYVQNGSKLIVWDHVTYYPNPAGGLGYIFFDGLDPSIGTTQGQGEWYLATEEATSTMGYIVADHSGFSGLRYQVANTVPAASLIGLMALILVSALVQHSRNDRGVTEGLPRSS